MEASRQVEYRDSSVAPGGRGLHFKTTEAIGIAAIEIQTLAVYTLDALATGQITGQTGDSFTAGRLGDYTVQESPDLGLNVLLGPPFVYNADNIDDFDW
jgi:hypothetical protein